jgi:two-component system sensor histidine kinase/response regulator
VTHAPILVVDDNDANRYTLVRLLTRAGHATIEAASGHEALARLEARPALVILDVQLPDMIGFEVCRRIKALADPPKVLQTSASFTRSEDRVEGLDGGADAYLVQPLQPAEFLATVASLLRLAEMEGELRAANRQLERSNGELERFAHVVSHDLQEPLRTIASFLGLLEMKYGPQLDERARTWIGNATGGAVRMSAMIRDLMVDAQLRGSEREVTSFPADAALDDVIQDLGARIAEAGAVVRREPLPVVCADRTRFARVLQNLFANALKFRAPERPPVITIACNETASEQRFTVADNGLGIPAEAQQRVFGMFERLHTHIPGTGIGLATIQGIIEGHGGRVGVESAVGVGSTFWFTLPRRAGCVEVAKPAPEQTRVHSG